MLSCKIMQKPRIQMHSIVNGEFNAFNAEGITSSPFFFCCSLRASAALIGRVDRRWPCRHGMASNMGSCEGTCHADDLKYKYNKVISMFSFFFSFIHSSKVEINKFSCF